MTELNILRMLIGTYHRNHASFTCDSTGRVLGQMCFIYNERRYYIYNATFFHIWTSPDSFLCIERLDRETIISIIAAFRNRLIIL